MSTAAPGLPERQRMPDRRLLWRAKVRMHLGGAELGFYVDCGCDYRRMVPNEIFLRPRGAFDGTLLGCESEYVGKSLSMLLQHGYTLAQLYRSFNRGSIARGAIAHALCLAWEHGAVLDEKSRELAEQLIAARAERADGLKFEEDANA